MYSQIRTNPCESHFSPFVRVALLSLTPFLSTAAHRACCSSSVPLHHVPPFFSLLRYRCERSFVLLSSLLRSFHSVAPPPFREPPRATVRVAWPCILDMRLISLRENGKTGMGKVRNLERMHTVLTKVAFRLWAAFPLSLFMIYVFLQMN